MKMSSKMAMLNPGKKFNNKMKHNNERGKVICKNAIRVE